MSKLIIFCFDGTGDDKTKSETDDVTNVVKISELLLTQGDNERDQVIFYAKGIATSKSDIKNKVQYITGKGLGNICGQAVQQFRNVYEVGDEVAAFGFSRGAATARGFVNVLADAKETNHSIPIRFLGLWDSVKFAMSKSLEQSIPDNVSYTCHLVAVDEQRDPFTPSLIDSKRNSLEVWFPGDHSDVGGGHADDSRLSDIALKFMISRAEEHGIAFRQDWSLGLPADNAYAGDVHTTKKELLTGWRRILPQYGSVEPKLHASVVAKMDKEGATYKPSNVISLDGKYTIVTAR